MLLQLLHRLLVPFLTLLHTFLFFHDTLLDLPFALRLQIVFFRQHLAFWHSHTLSTTSPFYGNHSASTLHGITFSIWNKLPCCCHPRHVAYVMQFAGPTMQSFCFLLVYSNHIGHESFHVHFLETLQQLTAHYTLVDYCLNWILIKSKHSRKSYGKQAAIFGSS